MFSDTDRRVGSTAVHFVTCDLLSFSDHFCSCASEAGGFGSSRRKIPAKPSPYLDIDTLSPTTARRLARIRPSCIDKLILENRSALVEMEGRRSVGKPLSQPLLKTKSGAGKGVVKRKRAESLPSNGTAPAIKRLRSAKGSESDSSPSRNSLPEKKRSVPSDKSSKPQSDKSTEDKSQAKSSVVKSNGNLASQKKIMRKSGKSRFSKRIVLSVSSLRSGKKRTESFKRKKIGKGNSKDIKNKKSNSDKTDSNSNVCTENESNDETIYQSTDSEVSRGPSEFVEDGEKDKGPEDVKKRRKRRKRDSMWVKKIKKQMKEKPENGDKQDKPPALEPYNESNNGSQSDLLDELPILDKESDDSCTMDFSIKNGSIDSSIPEEVSMPRLEKEVELPDPPEKLSFCNPGSSLINVPETMKSVLFQHTVPEVPAVSTDNTSEIVKSCKTEMNQDINLCLPPEKIDNLKNLDEENSLQVLSSIKNDLPLSNDLKDCHEEEIDSSIVKSLPEPSSENKVPVPVASDKMDSITEFCTPDISLKYDLKSTSPSIVEEEGSKVIKNEEETLSETNETKLIEKSCLELPANLEAPSVLSEESSTLCKIQNSDENSICDIAADDFVNVPECPVIESIVKQELEDTAYRDDKQSANAIPKSHCTDSDIKLPDIEPTIIDKAVEDSRIIEISPNKPSDAKEDFISSAQYLEDEITKLEAILEKSDSKSENFEAPSVTSKAEVDENIHVSSRVEEDLPPPSLENLHYPLSDPTCNEVNPPQHLDDVSLLAADSTSDMNHHDQSLDDSFGDFSLSLPDDLEESSASDDDREEQEILPDSTESEEQLPKEHLYTPEDNKSQPLIADNSLTADKDQPISSVSLISDVNISPLEKETVEANQPQENVTLELETKMDLDEGSLKQELSEPTPLAGSTPRKSSTDGKEEKPPEVKKEILTVEQRRMKESVLQALGLKSLSPVPPPPSEDKPKRDGYTGTLKAVIKLNRTGDKKKMVYQRSEDNIGELEYRICSEVPSTEGVPITHLNDIAALKKHPKFQHAIDPALPSSTASNGHSDDHESASNDDSINPSGKDLIIPEKSSSFSIHPGRLCSDVCTYCFGKFGCLDTPCHVAALKPDRQKKILENEPHLTGESCLCDACYRYVDRRANCPSKASSGPSKPRVKPPSSSPCCVNGCSEQATHTVKKKWLVKLKKSITNKLDMDLDKPGAMYFPLCAQHHYWVDYFTFCGICRKRLNRNHLYSLGSETDRLNLMLAEDGIPARLSDKLFLCKLCRYYSNLRLKYSDPSAMPSGSQVFYRDYRRKILTSLDVPFSDSDDEAPQDKKKHGSAKKISVDNNMNSSGSSGSGKTDESVMALSNLATLLGDQPEQQARIQVKFGNVNIGRLSNLNIGQGTSSREERSPYSDVGLKANLEFEATPSDSNWERCVSTIQFDKRTKKLWQDLQKPYGNQSSFLRHLVMLEKYWREGHLMLTPNADERVAKYLNGVKNRVKAFEGSTSTSSNIGEKVATPQPPPPSPAPPAPPPVAPSPPATTSDKFPLMMSTGEIEVTPITIPKRPVSVPASLSMTEKKMMTPLDRAKALVRMVPPTPPRQRFPLPVYQRYQTPMYNPPRGYPYPPQQPQRPPPLLKIRNSAMVPSPFYQQHIQIQQISPRQPPATQQFPLRQPPATQQLPLRQPPTPQQQPLRQPPSSQQQPLRQPPSSQQQPLRQHPSSQQQPLKPILPKLPPALTVTQVSQGGAAITLNRSGITIEKQTGTTPSMGTLPIEKPSISVFREPAPTQP